MKNLINNYLSPSDFDQFDHQYDHEHITENLPAQRVKDHCDDYEKSVFRRFRDAQIRAERSLKF